MLISVGNGGKLNTGIPGESPGNLLCWRNMFLKHHLCVLRAMFLKHVEQHVPGNMLHNIFLCVWLA